MEHQSTQQQRDDARLARRMHLHAERLGARKPNTLVQRSFTVTSQGFAAESLVLLMHTQVTTHDWHTEVRRLIDPASRGMTQQMIEDDFRHAVEQFLSKHQPAPAT